MWLYIMEDDRYCTGKWCEHGHSKRLQTTYREGAETRHPMLDAVRYVYENEFALVEDNTKSICGIITTTDISNQFLR